MTDVHFELVPLSSFYFMFQNNASKLLLAIMESRHDSENAERIMFNMSPKQLVCYLVARETQTEYLLIASCLKNHVYLPDCMSVCVCLCVSACFRVSLACLSMCLCMNVCVLLCLCMRQIERDNSSTRICFILLSQVE